MKSCERLGGMKNKKTSELCGLSFPTSAKEKGGQSGTVDHVPTLNRTITGVERMIFLCSLNLELLFRFQASRLIRVQRVHLSPLPSIETCG